ncbi:MAG: hypothetical protein QF848_15780 [Planctomycetota bacterium]|jgi:hypothetical protein|nr:hypothetical protein [Planctomycetota bacterium]
MTDDPVHQRDPEQAPDSDFEPARLAHLVVGNLGRMLDSRRTPFRLVDVQMGVGRFVFELTAFEDKGRTWSYPFENLLRRFQFARGSALADDATAVAVEAAIDRLERPLRLDADPAALAATTARVDAARAVARQFLDQGSTFFASDRLFELDRVGGEPLLADDLISWLECHDLGALEAAFADQYVSNPWASELVKGHRIVAAELGLCPFEGTVVRDPTLFDPPWDRAARAEHIVQRLAFVREVFSRAGLTEVPLYRAVSCQGPLQAPRNVTWVSSTFSRRVADAFFGDAQDGGPSVMYAQRVRIERLFMTHLETAEMNRQYQEVEAIVFFEPGNLAF